MKSTYTNAALSALLAGACFFMPGPAVAFDLNGAWVSDAENCAKVFVRRGTQVTFADMSDVYGGGFIIEGDQITGKYARCRIKAKKNEGANINLLAACASDIMLQNVQFSLREVDANTVIRMFPGISGMEIKYARCPVS
ncbi:hypothetical protein [Bradyrhizobium sp. LMTR 3]|uniref:hypothetical protein n=1 Tax=Bradyrhizobium sp. LMTR 3 TaxID=189873 RepID=UPI0008107F0A|nr:hypothetical protein [Bradyrhizobium sp. LMTR 3]OCK55130.1 hypothetical protein LMTR3_09485 [Bradyrhizobium sp. LMTR 3]